MKNSAIAWTDHTFNPWFGCSPVSEGCRNCYASDWHRRFRGEPYRGGMKRTRTSAAAWRQPLIWHRQGLVCVDCATPWVQRAGANDCECGQAGATGRMRRPRVFCASLSDWLDDAVPVEWLADLLGLIHATPNLDWLLLTKRPENWRSRVGNWGTYSPHAAVQGMAHDWIKGIAPANVWIGVTVENQAAAGERIPLLQDIPARVRFLSCEPLLERVFPPLNALGPENASRGVHWIIAGGESGPRARPCDALWLRILSGYAEAGEIPFFMKQAGRRLVGHGSVGAQPNDIDGRDLASLPPDLRIREFPTGGGDVVS